MEVCIEKVHLIGESWVARSKVPQDRPEIKQVIISTAGLLEYRERRQTHLRPHSTIVSLRNSSSSVMR